MDPTMNTFLIWKNHLGPYNQVNHALCQAREVSGRVFVCYGIDFASFYILIFHFGIATTVWYILFFTLML